ncbi:MAG: hypothetical protein R3A79_07725 [Nannocystaceae bacterium]
MLVDRWFASDAEISAGEAPSATFVVPDLRGRGDAEPLVLVDRGRLVVGDERPPPTADRPLTLSPEGCPDVQITLHPERAGPRPPGAGVAWRDLVVRVALGTLAVAMILLIPPLDPEALRGEAHPGAPGYADDDLSPVAWAMFNAPVYDPLADPDRPPGPAASGARSRPGEGRPGDGGESVEASGPRPGEGADGDPSETPAPQLPGDAPAPRDAPPPGDGLGLRPGEVTPMNEGAGGREDGLGLPGEGGVQGEGDDLERDGGRGGRTEVDPSGRGRGAEIRALERELVGRRRFGVQFIWEGYGQATITRDGDALRIAGEQRNADGDFVTIHGELTVVDPRTLVVEGTLATRIARCCGEQTQEGRFTFRKSGRRRFWRLDNPHRERFCDKYTCHYYIDIFDPR